MTTRAGGHERVYRGLLRIYPADYRAAYGEDMVQLFGDQLHDARNVNSTSGSSAVWMRALGDLLTSGASQRIRRNRTVAQSLAVAPTPVSRLLGLVGVAGGAILLAAFVMDFTPDINKLRIVLFSLGAIAVVLGVHMRQSAANPRLALLGAVPAIVTNVAYLILVVGPVAQSGALEAYLAGAMWISDLWFAVVTFRLGVMNRFSSVALIVGSIGVFLGMGVLGLAQPGSLMETVVLTGLALHGAAWILLGVEVALRWRPAMLRES